ncbi:MAG: hypothetical protein MHMPM18_000420 [Marteilia pararefringens]
MPKSFFFSASADCCVFCYALWSATIAPLDLSAPIYLSYSTRQKHHQSQHNAHGLSNRLFESELGPEVCCTSAAFRIKISRLAWRSVLESTSASSAEKSLFGVNRLLFGVTFALCRL